MTIRFTCSGCGSLLKIKDELAGTEGKCPKCKTEFVVPDEAADAESAETDAAAMEPVEAPAAPKEEKTVAATADKPPAKRSGKSNRGAAKEDFDPAEFLMEDRGPKRSIPAFDEMPDRPSTPVRRPAAKPPSSAEIPATGAGSNISASAHAKEMMMKAMEDSRLHAAELPPEEERPGFDYAGFFREFGVKGVGGLLFGLLLTYGLYLFFDGMMGTKLKLPKLAPVTGIVTLNGKPMAGVTVYFAPLDDTIPDSKRERTRTSFGITNDKGEYSMVYLGDVKGVAVGKCRVWLDLVTDKGQMIPPDYTEAVMQVKEVKPGKNDIPFEMKTQ